MELSWCYVGASTGGQEMPCVILSQEPRLSLRILSNNTQDTRYQLLWVDTRTLFSISALRYEFKSYNICILLAYVSLTTHNHMLHIYFSLVPFLFLCLISSGVFFCCFFNQLFLTSFKIYYPYRDSPDILFKEI